MTNIRPPMPPDLTSSSATRPSLLQEEFNRLNLLASIATGSPQSSSSMSVPKEQPLQTHAQHSVVANEGHSIKSDIVLVDKSVTCSVSPTVDFLGSGVKGVAMQQPNSPSIAKLVSNGFAAPSSYQSLQSGGPIFVGLTESSLQQQRPQLQQGLARDILIQPTLLSSPVQPRVLQPLIRPRLETVQPAIPGVKLLQNQPPRQVIASQPDRNGARASFVSSPASVAAPSQQPVNLPISAEQSISKILGQNSMTSSQALLLPANLTGMSGKVLIVNSPGKPPQAIAVAHTSSNMTGLLQAQQHSGVRSQVGQSTAQQIFLFPNNLQPRPVLSLAGRTTGSTPVEQQQAIQTALHLLTSQNSTVLSQVSLQPPVTAASSGMLGSVTAALGSQGGQPSLPVSLSAFHHTSQREIRPKSVGQSGSSVSEQVASPNPTTPNSRLAHFPTGQHTSSRQKTASQRQSGTYNAAAPGKSALVSDGPGVSNSNQIMPQPVYIDSLLKAAAISSVSANSNNSNTVGGKSVFAPTLSSNFDKAMESRLMQLQECEPDLFRGGRVTGKGQSSEQITLQSGQPSDAGKGLPVHITQDGASHGVLLSSSVPQQQVGQERSSHLLKSIFQQAKVSVTPQMVSQSPLLLQQPCTTVGSDVNLNKPASLRQVLGISQLHQSALTFLHQRDVNQQVNGQQVQPQQLQLQQQSGATTVVLQQQPSNVQAHLLQQQLLQQLASQARSASPQLVHGKAVTGQLPQQLVLVQQSLYDRVNTQKLHDQQGAALLAQPSMVNAQTLNAQNALILQQIDSVKTPSSAVVSRQPTLHVSSDSSSSANQQHSGFIVRENAPLQIHSPLKLLDSLVRQPPDSVGSIVGKPVLVQIPAGMQGGTLLNTSHLSHVQLLELEKCLKAQSQGSFNASTVLSYPRSESTQSVVVSVSSTALNLPTSGKPGVLAASRHPDMFAIPVQTPSQRGDATKSASAASVSEGLGALLSNSVGSSQSVSFPTLKFSTSSTPQSIQSHLLAAKLIKERFRHLTPQQLELVIRQATNNSKLAAIGSQIASGTLQKPSLPAEAKGVRSGLSVGPQQSAALSDSSEAKKLGSSKKATGRGIKRPVEEPTPAAVEEPAHKFAKKWTNALLADQARYIRPDLKAPFKSRVDALARLLPYHISHEALPQQKNWQKFDAAFSQVAEELIEKKNKLLDKFNVLMLEEAQIGWCAADDIHIGRILQANEEALFALQKRELLSGQRSVVWNDDRQGWRIGTESDGTSETKAAASASPVNVESARLLEDLDSPPPNADNADSYFDFSSLSKASVSGDVGNASDVGRREEALQLSRLDNRLRIPQKDIVNCIQTVEEEDDSEFSGDEDDDDELESDYRDADDYVGELGRGMTPGEEIEIEEISGHEEYLVDFKEDLNETAEATSFLMHDLEQDGFELNFDMSM